MSSTTESKQKPKGPRRAWLGRVLPVAAVIAVLGILVLSSRPRPIAVDLADVKKGPLQVTVSEDGRTRVKDRYVIGSPLLGNIARIELRPGDTIEKGQVLFRLVPLDPPLLDARTRSESEARVAAAAASQLQAKSATARAKVALELAEKALSEQRTLHEKSATTTQQLDRTVLEARSRKEELASAEFGAKVADHQAEMARAALSRLGGGRRGAEQLEVKSPVSGRVLKVIQQNEGVVQPGAPILELGDPAALELVVDVLTTDAVHILPGQRAWIERWGGAHALRAHVRLIEPSAFTRLSALGVEEQRVNVVLDLDEPREKWATLGDGYRIESRIILWEGADLTVTKGSAVFRSGDGFAAYTMKDGKVELRPVEIGHRGDLDVEITKGLNPGDVVIIHPSDQVKPGANVERRGL